MWFAPLPCWLFVLMMDCAVVVCVVFVVAFVAAALAVFVCCGFVVFV